MKIIGNNIHIKLLTSDDVTEDYKNWLEDNDVNQYLESRWRSYSVDDLKKYVSEINNGTTNFLFGIYDNSNNRHIGNIKIGNISLLHRYGDIGLFIGNKNFWGKGIGTESISLAVKYGFEELNLNKLIAGMYSLNIGSLNAFLKNRFKRVALYKQHALYKGSYVDVIFTELLKEDYKNNI